jgi:hypothetical protein
MKATNSQPNAFRAITTDFIGQDLLTFDAPTSVKISLPYAHVEGGRKDRRDVTLPDGTVYATLRLEREGRMGTAGISVWRIMPMDRPDWSEGIQSPRLASLKTWFTTGEDPGEIDYRRHAEARSR